MFKIMLLDIMILSAMCLAGCNKGGDSIYFCNACHSAYKTAFLKVNYVYKGKLFDSCRHDWKIYSSNKYPQSIANGQVILVNKNNTYGAFQFVEQSSDPEYAVFNWWYSSDGTNTIDKNNKELIFGQSKTVSENGVAHFVEFGPFKVLWSEAAQQKGWLYYPVSLYDIPNIRLSEYTSFCVTDLVEVDGVNLAEPKWIYKTNYCF